MITKYLHLLLFSVLLTSFVFSISYADRITIIDDRIYDMNNLSINSDRISDSLYIAKSKYNSENYEQGDLNKRLSEIEFLIQLAFENYDELNVLAKEINDVNNSYDITKALSLYQKSLEDFNHGRYEESLSTISSVRLELNNARSIQIRATTISSELTKSVFDFFIVNIKLISAIVIFIFVLYILVRKRIRVYFLKRDLIELSMKKETVENMIKNLQNNYFIKGSVTETEYQVKYLRYREMLTDLERQIALVNEQIVL